MYFFSLSLHNPIIPNTNPSQPPKAPKTTDKIPNTLQLSELFLAGLDEGES